MSMSAEYGSGAESIAGLARLLFLERLAHGRVIAPDRLGELLFRRATFVLDEAERVAGGRLWAGRGERRRCWTHVFAGGGPYVPLEIVDDAMFVSVDWRLPSQSTAGAMFLHAPDWRGE